MAPISHVYSQTVGDTTDTSVVRPSDWNSAHKYTQVLGGNTLNASTASGTDIVWAASGGVSLGGSTGTVVISVLPPATLSSYVPFEVAGANSTMAPVGTSSSGTVSFFPISVNEYVSAGMMNMVMNASFTTVGTSSGRQSAGMWYAMYSRGTGTNSTTMGTVDSASFSGAVTGNNSSYTISQATKTDFTTYTYSTTNSSGVNISSGYTGSKLVQFPVNVLMTPGVYWVGVIGTNSTSSQNVGMSLSVMGGVLSQQLLAPIGSFSSAYSTGTPFALGIGQWGLGHGSYTSANQIAPPVSVAYSNLTAFTSTAIAMVPYMKFWSS